MYLLDTNRYLIDRSDNVTLIDYSYIGDIYHKGIKNF